MAFSALVLAGNREGILVTYVDRMVLDVNDTHATLSVYSTKGLAGTLYDIFAGDDDKVSLNEARWGTVRRQGHRCGC